MRIFIRLFYTVFILAIYGLPAIAAPLPQPFKILPQPQKITLGSGKGIQVEMLKSVFLQGDFLFPVMGPNLARLPVTKKEGKNMLSLILDKANTSIPSDEGYLLTIAADKIIITAKTEAGIFYACQSLEQLLDPVADR